MPLTESHARQARPWCVFRSGSRAYAIGLAAVAEIIESDGLVRLPLSPPCVLGFCTFRRDVVPVVRLADGADTESDARLTILIVRTEQGTWGVKIERGGAVVVEALLDDTTVLTTVPAGPAFLGAIRREGQIYPALDPERTWRRFRDAVERGYSFLHDQNPTHPSRGTA